jgi:NAD-dependent dihydropyrimidine dehydrogenase PreA subunit
LPPLLQTHSAVVPLRFGSKTPYAIPKFDDTKNSFKVVSCNQREQLLKPPRVSGESEMAYVIAEPCIGTKDSACVDVCPVDCIHPRKDEAGFEAATQLYINPDECIDCGACVPVCPVTAIFALEDLPEKWSSFTKINADYYKKT